MMGFVLVLLLPAVLLALLLLRVYLRDRRLRKHLGRKVIYSEARDE
ncbi:MAG TPA: hypothetical protein PLU72_16975 [Candidatus Ozemobacteraceae bacterium]|nr:hypothetical protein [Candidatus Ozemobacteraceae bacterium]HQG27602.1 hypothetical protein [Candidatus Ozemobacteraceae bacterium]